MAGSLKRKRDSSTPHAEAPQPKGPVIQLIAGSYERALHGIVSTIELNNAKEHAKQPGKDAAVTFSDNFLINAHASSVRCLALSPASDPKPNNPSKRILATGGADERINLYQIAASMTPRQSTKSKSLREHPQNLELGSLLHHTSTVTTLSFPSKGKLISGGMDNKIAISRVRDWTVLSEIKAPVPKVSGRPSGDTAAPGEVPAGINDVAVHPSAKLCLSVGQGEKSMRLWNLVTGKKAGVLTFEKAVLAALGEGFEHGAVVYDLACTIRGVAKAEGTKVCRVRYLPARTAHTAEVVNGARGETTGNKTDDVVALSTEDGRILFYHTASPQQPLASSAAAMENGINKLSKAEQVPILKFSAQLGERARGERIKDFVVLSSEQEDDGLFVVAASSNGAIKIWQLSWTELDGAEGQSSSKLSKTEPAKEVSNGVSSTGEKQVGRLLGVHETGRRITCLEAFLMTPVEAVSDDVDGSDAWDGFESDE